MIMKEIILKFFDPPNFSTFMAEITAFFGVLLAWKKFKSDKKKENKEIYKVAFAKKKVDELLGEIQIKIKSSNVIPAVAELTNGGGVPQVDKPMYIRAVNSISSEILSLWGEKSMCTSPMIKTITRMYSNGYANLDVEAFDSPKVNYWAGSKKIVQVWYFFIGIDGNSRALLLALNKDNFDDFTDGEMVDILETISEIKKTINRGRKWFWCNKIT